MTKTAVLKGHKVLRQARTYPRDASLHASVPVQEAMSCPGLALEYEIHTNCMHAPELPALAESGHRPSAPFRPLGCRRQNSR